jgi:hypothetical protein
VKVPVRTTSTNAASSSSRRPPVHVGYLPYG